MLGGSAVDVDLVSPVVFVWGRCKTRGGGQSDREQYGFDWKREGIGTEWSWGRPVGLACEAAYGRLAWSRRIRVREKRFPATSSEIEKARIIFKYYSCCSIKHDNYHDCLSNDDILQLLTVVFNGLQLIQFFWLT